MASRFDGWRRDVVLPRLRIVRLLPSAGMALVVVVLGINVVVGLLPVVFIVATSRVIGGVPAVIAAGAGSSALGEVAAAFLTAAAAFVVQQIATTIVAMLGERMKRRVDGALRDDVATIALRGTSIAPLEDAEALNALNEVTRLFDTSTTTPGMACAGLLGLVARYLRLVALLVVVGAVTSWPTALVLGGTAMMFRYGQRGGLRKYSAVWREVAGITRRSTYLRELAMGPEAAKEIRVFGLVDWLEQRYAASFRAAYDHVKAKRRQIYLVPYLVYVPIGLLVAATIIAMMALDASAGLLSVFELSLGIQATIAAVLLGEFYAESDVPTQFGMQAVSALEEFRQRVGRPGAEGPVGRLLSPSKMAPTRCLRFEKVSFHYPASSRLVLDALDFELPAGKSTAIVGINGAGKTTIVKLLTRLYEPTDGAISLDGTPIARLDPAAWRRQVSVVFQDFVRYELSAADNIRFGAAHAQLPRTAIETAAREAGILDFLEDVPTGLDTPLARAYSGGIDLSGGQWQRVAIARALYALRAGARVLVLDEPTAALDVRAEAAFFDRFVELTRGATSVLISHRFSSVRRADRIVVIDAGKVIEQGSHAELMALDGYYAELFRLQAERFGAGAEANGRGMDSSSAESTALAGKRAS